MICMQLYIRINLSFFYSILFVDVEQLITIQNLSLQKSCIDFVIQARPLERYMPKDRRSCKYKIWKIAVSTPFEYFIMVLIILNTILLMVKVSGLQNLHYFNLLNDTFQILHLSRTLYCNHSLKCLANGQYVPSLDA